MSTFQNFMAPKITMSNTIKTTLAFKIDQVKTLKYEIKCLRENLKKDAKDAKQYKLEVKRLVLERKLQAINAKLMKAPVEATAEATTHSNQGL